MVVIYSLATTGETGPTQESEETNVSLNDTFIEEVETIPVGRLLMIGHFADTPVASTTALITDLQVGGVIIMSAPEDPQEIKNWTAEWQSASSFPLLIAIDQEGGPVSRLKGPDFIQTGQRDIKTETEAYEIGKIRGEELASLGINMNFAPVLDSSSVPSSFMYSRTFGEGTNPAALAAKMYAGMKVSGITAAAKHFPGHGDTEDDSHEILPTVFIERGELDNFTSNFREYISKTNPNALMTAHVLFPNIDPLPATFSPFFLKTYLRQELGFTGMIITDDMSMDAIDKNWSTSEAALLSLQAGADMVLFAAEPEKARDAVLSVQQALADNTITEEDISLKVDRQKEVLTKKSF